MLAQPERSAQAPAPARKEVYAREGSPWTGLWAVVAKEMADSLTSTRMLILELITVLTAAGTVYAASGQLRETVGQDRFLFLRLFTTAREPLPAFIGFLVFLIPIIAIALAFDTINGEFSQRTMSRLLAQPIYRDALLLGKFLAGLGTLSLVLTTIWLLICGLGLLRLGVPPGGEEAARIIWHLVLTIAYGGVWLALALLCSIVFRQPATAVLAALAVWLFFTIFWEIIAGMLAQVVAPVRIGMPSELLAQAQAQLALTRISPNTLYAEATLGLLNPQVRSLGLVLSSQMDQAVRGAPLPLGQSVLLIWPHLTGLAAMMIAIFALGYVLFQRREVRA
ncbi:MAG: ABC transporter permease [Chloroflexales bacterium]|nr:ABC transporter permease [Chloroflexales bacterium]